MRCYLIRESHIAVLSQTPASPADGAILIESIKNLDQNRFPVSRLVTLWNNLPGAEPVKRFRDRPAGLKRLWAAMENMPISTAGTDSKQARLIALLQRPKGASIEELTTATGWQTHSVRGVLSGVLRKKLGLNVTSAKDGNTRVYRITP